MEILRVENICKTYEMDNAPVHALSDISFSEVKKTPQKKRGDNFRSTYLQHNAGRLCRGCRAGEKNVCPGSGGGCL